MNVGVECETITTLVEDGLDHTLQQTIKTEPDNMVGTCFSLNRNGDPDDHEVAMVTNSSQVGSSSYLAGGFTSSSRSSSGLHSGLLSLTPGSSSNTGIESDQDSCDSPLDVVYDT